MMSRMSETEPLGVAALSIGELRAALLRQRATNTQLRTVIGTQAELHQAELAAKDAAYQTELAKRDAALAAKDAQIAQLQSQVAVLGDRVAQLERRAGRDSSNSNRPPSSDSPYTKKTRKPKDRSLRGRSGRKPGKQPGEPGAALSQVGDPDHTVVCAPAICAGCGRDLADVPVAAAQAGVTGRAQYGPEVHAQAANLTVANHVPVGRAAGLLGGMLGVEVSVGFVAGVRGKAAGRLEPVRELLRQAEVVHADETPGRADGKVAYVHVACTEFLTHLHVGGRAATDIDAGGVLVGYAGTIVRDGYAGYAHLAEALHAWCGAHSLRDLRAVWEADPQGQAWAGSMADLLVYANKAAGAGRAARQRWMRPRWPRSSAGIGGRSPRGSPTTSGAGPRSPGTGCGSPAGLLRTRR